MAITRARIEQRRTAVPLGVISYSQAKTNTYTGRRSDCSGLVSYVWDLRTSGVGTYLGAFSTGTLYTQGLIIEVPLSQLRPGDAIGYCGPTSPGNGGHIALWLGTRADGYHHVWDHGSGMGPKDRWVKWDGKSTGWLHPDKLRGWRCVDVVEEDGTTYSPLSRVEDEIVDTKTLQEALIAAGYDLGKTGADGSYGPKTKAAFVAALAPASGGAVAEKVSKLEIAVTGQSEALKVLEQAVKSGRMTKAEILAVLAE